MDGKICTGCHCLKLYNHYYKETKAPDGLRAKCKECQYFTKKNHREKNRDKYKKAFQEFMDRNPNYYKKNIPN